MEKDRKENKNLTHSVSTLLRLATLLLAAVSFYSTACGMSEFVFPELWQSYAASLAIQGMLVGLNFYLPTLLSRVFVSQNNLEGKTEQLESQYKWIKWHCVKKPLRFLGKLALTALILVLSFIVLFCSSWFSYLYIVGKAYEKSWATESEILIQKTYRDVLFESSDYVQIFKSELKDKLSEDVLSIYKYSKTLNPAEDTNAGRVIDWATERNKYTDNTPVSTSMSFVINAMETATTDGASDEARTTADDMLNDVKKQFNTRKKELGNERTTEENNIAGAQSRLEAVNRQIQNAAYGTDTSGLEQTARTLQAEINRHQQRIDEIDAEITMYNNALLDIQAYGVLLSTISNTSDIRIGVVLNDINNKLLSSDQNTDELIIDAQSLLKTLQDASDVLSNDKDYTELLVRIDLLIANLKKYSQLCNIDSSLQASISELATDEFDYLNETDVTASDISRTSDNTARYDLTASNSSDAASEQTATTSPNKSNKEMQNEKEKKAFEKKWRLRLEKLKSVISGIPAYDDNLSLQSQVTASDSTTIAKTYDRAKCVQQLDEMIRLYLGDIHNSLQQGMIYLTSNYNDTAIFSLVLAFLFDVGAFITGFVVFITENKDDEAGSDDDNKDNPNASSKKKAQKKRMTESDERELQELYPQKNYIFLTGKYEYDDGIYSYDAYDLYDLHHCDELMRIERENEEILKAGVYLLDDQSEIHYVEHQEICFYADKGKSKDGIYMNVEMKYSSGALLMKRDDSSEFVFIVQIPEDIPVYHMDNSSFAVYAAEKLRSIKADTLIIACAENENKIAAIYLFEEEQRT